MMDFYASEEERLIAVKRWWKESGRSAIVGVLTGIALIIGWNLWQKNSLQQAQEASRLYQQLIVAVEKRETQPAEKLSERIIEQYDSTTYATYARFFLAKLKAEAGDFKTAKAALEQIIASTRDENYRRLARLRLGQVMLAAGEAEAALKMITSLPQGAAGRFEGNYEELKGDLYASLNRPAEARAAYQKARQLGVNSVFLEMKLDDLAEAPEPAQ
jgi:predicted negative regulator of RcsB-dependent stress response